LKKRRPYTRFNSTLGYPGEGPATLVSWNARGLCEKLKFAELLRRLSSAKIDAALIQEHNWSAEKQRMARSVARTGEWQLYVKEYAGEGRGGAMVLVRNEGAVKVTGTPLYSADGRVVAVPVTVDEQQTRLVCVYSPSKPAQRMGFVSALGKSTGAIKIRKTDIVMGDFNTVPNVNLDTKGDAEYANVAGRATEALLAKAGLTDVYRLFHGDKRSYTRHGETQYTRLDRVYAQKYNSLWRWTSIEHDASIFEGRHLSSDHSAVVVKMESPAPRGSTKVEERIDPSIFRNPEVRQCVRKLWEGTYRSLKGHEEGHKWYRAKLAVGKYLLDETRDKRRRKASRQWSLCESSWTR